MMFIVSYNLVVYNGIKMCWVVVKLVGVDIGLIVICDDLIVGVV